MKKENKNWLLVSIIAWLALSLYFLLKFIAGEAYHGGPQSLLPFVFVATLMGGVITAYFLAIPLRIAMNLTRAERRRKYCGETIALVLILLFIWYVISMSIQMGHY